MEQKHIQMFLDWAGSLDKGTKAERNNRKMRKAIAKQLGMDEHSELVLFCLTFCAGVNAAKEQI